jgi:integrase
MRPANKLTAKTVEKTNAPGMYGDGLGLWLQVKEVKTKSGPSIAKSWVFRYRGRYLGLGPTHTINLAEARTRARQARQIILDGEDPIEAKRRKRDQTRAEAAERMLFKTATEEFLDLHRDTWRNRKHKQQWENTLATYAFPTLGNRPVSAIDGALITEALASIWTKKPETARRTKQRVERVLQWVKDGKPLPSQSAAKRVEHHPAMQFSAIPEFMAELRGRDSVSARALEFTILTVARTGDTIDAKWTDVDLESGIWAVPDDEHKTGKLFEIPLPLRAVEILKGLPRERGNPHVFIGGRKGRGLSNAAMAELLKGMHKARASAGLPALTDKHSGRLAVPHGFRSSFRDWAGDCTNFARELIETAMSHKIPDRVEAAYRRSSALEKRRKLMDAWARYCSSATTYNATSKVVALHG